MPASLALPPSLTFLEIDSPLSWAPDNSIKEPPMFLESLPTTLTHLQLFSYFVLVTEIEVTKLPFRKMPLTYFYGNIKFSNLSKDNAHWDVLPPTIEYLQSELSYGDEGEIFEKPKTPSSWKQLFPKLTHLDVPMDSLADSHLVEASSTALFGQDSEKQIELIRSSFPESLTSLKMSPIDSTGYYEGLPLLIYALGDRLRRYEHDSCSFSSAVLKQLPKWENPRVKLMNTIGDGILARERIVGSDNSMENLFSDKNHPIFNLCSSATSLKCGILPASAISLLPKTLTSMEFDNAEQEPLSLSSALTASHRMTSNDKNDAIDKEGIDIDNMPAWMALGWPPKLTTLRLSLYACPTLHLQCLPPTLRELTLVRTFSGEGGDLAHLKELSTLNLIYGDRNLGITSLDGFPRSLRRCTAFGTRISDRIVLNPDFQNFFMNLENLDLTGSQYSVDALLYLPRTLKVLFINIGEIGLLLSEKHFESIFRSKLSFLSLIGISEWPKDLSFDVFSRFMPISLASLVLHFHPPEHIENFEKNLSEHIPATLLEFHSNNELLCKLVKNRIEGHNNP